MHRPLLLATVIASALLLPCLGRIEIEAQNRGGEEGQGNRRIHAACFWHR